MACARQRGEPERLSGIIIQLFATPWRSDVVRGRALCYLQPHRTALKIWPTHRTEESSRWEPSARSAYGTTLIQSQDLVARDLPLRQQLREEARNLKDIFLTEVRSCARGAGSGRG